jgi:hypothetical protein
MMTTIRARSSLHANRMSSTSENMLISSFKRRGQSQGAMKMPKWFRRARSSPRHGAAGVGVAPTAACHLNRRGICAVEMGQIVRSAGAFSSPAADGGLRAQRTGERRACAIVAGGGQNWRANWRLNWRPHGEPIHSRRWRYHSARWRERPRSTLPCTPAKALYVALPQSGVGMLAMVGACSSPCSPSGS